VSAAFPAGCPPNENPPDPIEDVVVGVAFAVDPPNDNPPATLDEEEGAASDLDVVASVFAVGAPNENPPAPIDDGAVSDFALVVSVFVADAPNEKPPAPIDDADGAESGFAEPPNENPPAPIEDDDEEAAAPPNENPPAPIDDVEAVPTFAGGPPRAASSNPGRGVSQATHFFALSLLRTEHTSHFHVDSSTLKMLPSDSTLTSSLVPAPVPPVSSSSLSLSSSSSSLSSPSPNNQSMYHSKKSDS